MADELEGISDKKIWDICEKKYGWFLTYRWEIAGRFNGVKPSNPALFKKRGVAANG